MKTAKVFPIESFDVYGTTTVHLSSVATGSGHPDYPGHLDHFLVGLDLIQTHFYMTQTCALKLHIKRPVKDLIVL